MRLVPEQFTGWFSKSRIWTWKLEYGLFTNPKHCGSDSVPLANVGDRDSGKNIFEVSNFDNVQQDNNTEHTFRKK